MLNCPHKGVVASYESDLPAALFGQPAELYVENERRASHSAGIHMNCLCCRYFYTKDIDKNLAIPYKNACCGR
jgi:hypothetical protein